MGWASHYIDRLKQGETVTFRPRGGSMKGRVESGQRCTVEPLGEHRLDVGDVVLCTVRGAQYLHLIRAIRGQQYQIGNNRGGINGWVGLGQIHGKCVRVED